MMQEAVDFIQSKTEKRPRIALILGSGLGDLADTLDQSVAVSTTEIPHYPHSTVQGHAGRWAFGTLAGQDVICVQGRVHYYEGHSIRQVTFPIRLLHALGVTHLIVTNAAGGINDTFSPGTIMFIEDHINLTGQNPLIGPNEDGGPRFPDMSDPYHTEWRKQAEAIALVKGIATRTGVYIGVTGPSYETKAEIKMFRKMGADAVGMSTVPEVIQAVYCGMRVLGISTITNLAAGMQGPLNHTEVMEVGAAMKERLSTLIRGLVQAILL